MPKRSQDETILVDQVDGVTTIWLNRPEKHNSLSPTMVSDLFDSILTAQESESTRLIVLTNKGTTFCAGADLSAATPGRPDTTGPSFADLLALIMDGPKPVVGLINGHCMGGGVGLAAACDISLMNSESKLGFTEVRLGVSPAIISVVCLPKMSIADARELFLTGQRISAERSVAVGLINRCCPPDELEGELGVLIDDLLKGGPQALATAKMLIRHVPTLDRESGFEFATDLSARLFDSAEAKAGVEAFRSKRDAPWIPET